MISRSVVKLVASLLISLAAPGAWGNPDRVADALTEKLGIPFAGERGFLQLGGQIDLRAYTYRNGGPTGFYFLKPGRRTDFSPRATLTLDAFWESWLYGFVKFRWDDGLHPGVARFYGAANDQRFDEVFLRYQREDGAANVQVGRFTPVFGAFLGRHDPWENPFVNFPLTYENVSSVSDVFVPANAQAFAARRNSPDNKLAWVSPIWAPLYVQGASVFGSVERLEYAATVANRAPSSRGITWNDYDWGDPTLYLHAAYRPTLPWRIGMFGSYGPYLQDAAQDNLGPGQAVSDYNQSLFGVFSSYHFRRVTLTGEWVETRYEVPNVGKPTIYSYFVEAKYQMHPRAYVAARWNQQFFKKIRAGGERLRWDDDLYRIDLGTGYRPYRSLLLKGGYSYQRQEGDFQDGEHLWVLESSWRF